MFNYNVLWYKREGKKKEIIDERKMSEQIPPAPTASVVRPCPTPIQLVGHPALNVNPEPSHHSPEPPWDGSNTISAYLTELAKTGQTQPPVESKDLCFRTLGSNSCYA